MDSLCSAGAPAPVLFGGGAGGGRAYGLTDLRPAGHAGGAARRPAAAAAGLMGLRICARHAGAGAPAAPVSCDEVRRT